MNSNTNSPKKMTPSQLEGWLAIRKKCSPQKSKKAYTRKEKHKQKFQKSQDIEYNIYRKSGEELQTLFLSFEDSSPTKLVMRLMTVIRCSLRLEQPSIVLGMNVGSIPASG